MGAGTSNHRPTYPRGRPNLALIATGPYWPHPRGLLRIFDHHELQGEHRQHCVEGDLRQSALAAGAKYFVRVAIAQRDCVVQKLI
jgi:hypothetical protein